MNLSINPLEVGLWGRVASFNEVMILISTTYKKNSEENENPQNSKCSTTKIYVTDCVNPSINNDNKSL